MKTGGGLKAKKCKGMSLPSAVQLWRKAGESKASNKGKLGAW